MRAAALALLLLGLAAPVRGSVTLPRFEGLYPRIWEGEGRLTLSWMRTGPEGSSLHYVGMGEGGWDEPRVAARGEGWLVNWADVAHVAVLPSGLQVAQWLVEDPREPYAYGIRLARSLDDGRTWSDPITPHGDGTATEHGFVSMVPGRRGGTMRLVWLDGRAYAAAGGGHGGGEGATALRTALLDADGRVVDERELDGRVCDCCPTDAVRVAGDLVVAYRDRSVDEIRDIAVVRRRQGLWSSPSIPHPDHWEIPACPVNGPALDVQDSLLVMAWYTGAEPERVRVSFSTDAGASFGPAFDVDEGDPLGRVDVALLADGSAVVSWIGYDDRGRGRLLLRRIRPDGARGAAVEAAPLDAGRDSGFPRLAEAGRRLLVAWTADGVKRVLVDPPPLP